MPSNLPSSVKDRNTRSDPYGVLWRSEVVIALLRSSGATTVALRGAEQLQNPPENNEGSDLQ